MKYDLTEKDYRAIFNLAHREWLDDSGHSSKKEIPSQYLLARSYLIAVTSYLVSKGYTIELTNDKKQDKG